MSVDTGDTDDSAGPTTYNERSWSNPFPSYLPLHDLFDEIVSENRDLIIIVDDMKARRGTGKTVLSLKLADALDQTPEGLTWDKVAMAPEEVRNAIISEPVRSGIVLDEGEFGASNRDPMTGTNKALREVLSMGRIKQKYLVVNAPVRTFIDSDIQKLADAWVGVWRKGLALVHFYDFETYSGQNLTPKTCLLPFGDIPAGDPLRDVYNRLDSEKKNRLDGEGGAGYIPVAEHEERLRKEREQARQDQRDDAIRQVWLAAQDVDGFTQSHLGDAFGITRQRINQILSD